MWKRFMDWFFGSDEPKVTTLTVYTKRGSEIVMENGKVTVYADDPVIYASAGMNVEVKPAKK